MQQKIQYNTIYSSHRYYRRFFKNFPTFHILKTHPPITYILSSLYQSYQSFQSSNNFLSICFKIEKKKRKKETTLLPLFSKISSFSRQGWSIHVTINLIKLHRIAIKGRATPFVPFVGQNRCAPLNDARRRLCDGKLTPSPCASDGKPGNRIYFAGWRKGAGPDIKISKRKFTDARHCRIRCKDRGTVRVMRFTIEI